MSLYLMIDAKLMKAMGQDIL